MKTVELSGRALDCAVALAEGGSRLRYDTVASWWITIDGKNRVLSKGWSETQSFYPSSGQAGDDIIDREGITTIRCEDDFGTDAEGFTTDQRIPVWAATLGHHGIQSSTEHQYHAPMYQIDTFDVVYGATRREAAMRAWCLHKLGEDVDIPEALA